MKTVARALLLASSTVALAAAPARAQTAEAGQDAPTAGGQAGAEEAGEVPAGSEIVVTGSRAANRTVADSPVPIDVLPAETLVNSGFTDTNRVLNQLVPSFNFPQPAITDGTDVVRPATLRGLAPDQTLVLVNGKRRHISALLNINGSVGRGSAAVDINLIPTSALSRVEVLRDGAAAQYGSDAIAGVINFRLNEAREGGRVSATYGFFDTAIDDVFQSTGPQLNAAGAPVLAPDSAAGGNIFALQNNGRRLRVTDGETLTVSGNIGLPLGPEGFLNLTAEYRDRNATNRTGYDPRRQYGVQNGPVDPREFSFNRRSHRYGDPKVEDVLLFANAGLPLGQDFTLYAFGSFADRAGTSGAFYRLSNDARNVLGIYPDGFLPLINSDTDDLSGVVGVRGELAGFNVDLSTNYARNRFDYRISNTLNASIGRTSPTEFDAGGLRYSQFLTNLDLSREFEIGGIDQVTFAVGAEYREETFRIRAGEVDSYRRGTPPALVGANNPTAPGAAAPAAPGSQGFPGFAPVIAGQDVTQRRKRDNISAYAELDIDFSDRLNLQVAGRYEDYSDFGSDFNGKVAGRFELVDGVAIRGAASTGFRAPSLQQQFYAASATNNVGGVLLETVTLPVDNPVAVALGATPLDAETSVSYSAGLVLTPFRGLNVTVDVYQVDIDDRIVVTENLTANRAANATDPGRSIARILDAAGFTDTNAARFFVNGVDTRTRGLDAVATYRFDLGGAGDVRATVGYNYNETEITGVATAPGPLAQVPGVVLFGRQESLRFERGQPRSKLNLGLDYDNEPFGLSLRANRFGRVLGAGADQFGDVVLPGKLVTDLELRFQANDGFQFALGANNLFDVYPDPVPTGRGVDPANGAARNYPATNYVAPYSAFSPFGFNGRFLYARAAVNF